MSITPNTCDAKESLFNDKMYKQKYKFDDVSPFIEHIGSDQQIQSIDVDSFNEIEKMILDYVMSELKNKKDSETYYADGDINYPDNMYACDIFYNSKADNTVKKHVILLWKKTKDTYVLIDPNNKEFSERQKTLLNKNYSNYGTFGHIQSLKGEIYKSPIEKKYCNYDNDPIYARDCKDLSIKFGYILKELHREKIQFLDLEHILIAKVTNVYKEMDRENKIRMEEGSIFREKFSSDKKIRDDYDDFIKTNHMIIEKIFFDGIPKDIPLCAIKNMVDYIVKCNDEFNKKFKARLNIGLKK